MICFTLLCVNTPGVHWRFSLDVQLILWKFLYVALGMSQTILKCWCVYQPQIGERHAAADTLLYSGEVCFELFVSSVHSLSYLCSNFFLKDSNELTLLICR